jgi:hypothetical protein
MAQTFQTISTGDPWVKGETYKLIYDVDHIQLFGMTLPDELVPDAIREAIAKRQIDQMVTKLQDDPRLKVLGYEYYGQTFSIDVLAIQNPFPVAVVVVGIIALAILFGIALVTREIKQLVESANELAKTIGPLGTNAIIFAVVGIIVLGLVLTAKSYV